MLHRRDAMIRLGTIGLGTLSLPTLLKNDAVRAAQTATGPNRRPSKRGTARSCILIYLWGGPPQQDIWDLKPESPLGMRSHFRPISTAVPGIDVCEHLPRFARHTDKVAIIRSLTHESNNHEPSVYRTLTGRINNTLVVPRNQRSRGDFPNVAGIVSSMTPLGDIPASVTVPRPIGHSGVTYAGTYAGFLGPRSDPMEMQAAADTGEKPTHPLILASDVRQARLQARQGLLKVLEGIDRHSEREKRTGGLDSFREQAISMLTSPRAKRAFNLDLEDPRTRDRYGRNEYGESMLLARRLTEAGVRLVTISWMYVSPTGRVANVWDNHGPFEGKNGTEMLVQQYCLPSLDRGFAALVEDLAAVGSLDETLIAMFGEFGRTPKLNPANGRDHWGACQSAVLTGGGIRGGQIYGSSDRDAAYPRTNPVSPEDLLATIYAALGIDHEALIHDQTNRPYRLVDGKPLLGLFG
jgi:hypothetical protein